MMVVMPGRLRVDTERFIHDTIDGETVIIDTVAGQLTLLVGFGPTVWGEALAGVELDVLAAETSGRFGATAADEVRQFIDGLVEAGMLTVDDEASGAGTTGATGWPDTYATPQLEQYDDIADIMTMDPIHEVDTGRGWPLRSTTDG
jgi:hypothetical protein